MRWLSFIDIGHLLLIRFYIFGIYALSARWLMRQAYFDIASSLPAKAAAAAAKPACRTAYGRANAAHQSHVTPMLRTPRYAARALFRIIKRFSLPSPHCSLSASPSEHHASNAAACRAWHNYCVISAARGDYCRHAAIAYTFAISRLMRLTNKAALALMCVIKYCPACEWWHAFPSFFCYATSPVTLPRPAFFPSISAFTSPYFIKVTAFAAYFRPSFSFHSMASPL